MGSLYQTIVLIFLTSEEPSVNRIDLLALTLAGPIRHKPVLDPLAVHFLENQLSISVLLNIFVFTKNLRITEFLFLENLFTN